MQIVTAREAALLVPRTTNDPNSRRGNCEDEDCDGESDNSEDLDNDGNGTPIDGSDCRTRGLASAAPWRVLLVESGMPTVRWWFRAWLMKSVLGRAATHEAAALVALICGAWWAAPSAYRPDINGAFGPPTCAACCAESTSLPIHLLCCGVSGETRCQCTSAATVRREWEDAVCSEFAKYDTGAQSLLAAALAQSFKRIALMLGCAAGGRLPWDLAYSLPGIFADTWGAWSAQNIRERR